MHTLLEYRAGKLNCHQRSSSSPPSRTNKYVDSVSAAAAAAAVDDSDRSDNDQVERLESVQLILRASQTLRQLHLINGHNGRASVDTTNCLDRITSGFKDASTTYGDVMFATTADTGSTDADHVGVDTKSTSNSLRSVRRIQLSGGRRIGGIMTTTSLSMADDGATNGDIRRQKSAWMSIAPTIDQLSNNGFARKEVMSKVFNGAPTTPTTIMAIDNEHEIKRQPRSIANGHDKRLYAGRQIISHGVNRSPSLFEEIRDDDGEDPFVDNVGFFLQENNKNNSKDVDGVDVRNRRRGVAADGGTSKSIPFNSFAGFRNYMMPERAICGATGTVRGMRNRVRAGIATFKPGNSKNLHQMESGKVVVYTTSTGIVRETFQQCLRVKTILNTLLIGFEERDIFKCRAYQRELSERFHDHGGDSNGSMDDNVRIPQVFVEGYHLGNANVIEELNECGRLRKILRPYQRASDNQVCQKCGGYLLLLCLACNGSKKSVTRNPFTNTLLPLRCTKCDECGLVPCDTCCYHSTSTATQQQSLPPTELSTTSGKILDKNKMTN